MQLADNTARLAYRQGARSFTRLVAAGLFCEANGGFLATEAQTLWTHDKTLHNVVRSIVSRAAVTPTSTSNVSALGQPTIVSDLLNTLATVSAGALILSSGLKVRLENVHGIVAPMIANELSEPGTVAEGDAIPIGQLDIDASNLLTPKYIKEIFTCTRELMTHATPTFEAVIDTVVKERFAAKLDAMLLSTSAGDAATSAGLLNGVIPLTASAEADSLSAMLADVKSAVGGVAAIAANSPVILVANPVRAVALRGFPDRVPYKIFGSSALDDELIAIAPRAIISSVDETPEIEKSREATLIMRTDPGAFSAVGTPATIMAPIRSTFQTDSISLKVRLQASWLRRNDAAVAIVDGIEGW